MALIPFLAMTAMEMRNISDFPPKIAWMACHFSPYSLGLSNLPRELPPGSLLIVDDITPPHCHDPALITEQLTWCTEALQSCGILLDFQRQNCRKTAALAKHLAEGLPCPVIVSACYAENLACPVFLPPVPPSVPLKEFIAPWQGREIWLEIGLCGELLTLTEKGCTVMSLPSPDPETRGFCDQKLHCHYTIETEEKAARFTLWRQADDLTELLMEAEEFGITTTVGLYQELR